MDKNNNRLPILIGNHTYGYYYQNSGTFECTHGAWESECDLLDDLECYLKVIDKTCEYRFIDKIPEDFIL